MKNQAPRISRAVVLAGVAGTIGAMAASAYGQAYVVNVSGASLLENYLKAPAATNDYIDVDGDGIAGSLGSGTIDQLAPFYVGATPPAGMHFAVQYRVTGSVYGFIELAQFGGPTFLTTDDTDVNGILGARPGAGVNGVATTAYINRTKYIDLGVGIGTYNQGNAGGAPYRADTTTLQASYASPPNGATGGVRIDVTPMDVPVRWATQVSGDAGFSLTPGVAGYGTNPRLSTNRQGGLTGFGGLTSQLPDLYGRNLFDPSNPGAADSNTIFSSAFAWAPIAPVTNFGTGVTRLKTSELRWMFVTGRSKAGENFIVCTRDAGSGTRNAWSNCLGIDPSWSVGDNIGGISTLSVNNNLGADFTPTNKGTNGGMEATLRNVRLGIGYVGAERGVTGSGSGSWLSTHALEIVDTMNDIYAGTQYVRPITDNIIHNNANGWVIGGPSIIATIGDPGAEPVSVGGLGHTTPQMANHHAAAFVNNILRSVENFVSVPNDVANVGMPGEYAATQFVLPAALDYVHDFSTPTTLNANGNFNGALQAYTAANSVYNNGAYVAFDTSAVGNVPVRTTGTTYSDGVPSGTNYLAQGGAAISYGSALTLRNKITGDFNGNGVRDAGDVIEMLHAYRQRNAGPVWVAPNGSGPLAGAPGSDAIIEILGDFDADGSFTRADVRYFADGLFMVGGQLDRAAGFTRVDSDWQSLTGSNNFFGTTKAHGAYQAGDSRADVFGPSGNVAAGWAPVGADGRIDCEDITYIYRQFRQNPGVTDGAANWDNLAEAATFDLSCDLNADMVVDQADVDAILAILGTTYGDVNLDGVVDQADCDIITTNLGMTNAKWCDGDMDGDGVVTTADRDFIQIVTCDYNQDGGADTGDVIDLANDIASGTASFPCNTTDYNQDGGADTGDVIDLANAIASGTCQ